MNRILVNRHTSTLLKEFLKSDDLISLPCLPGKRISALDKIHEIEARKNGLEYYIRELLNNPAIICCYNFRNFIGEVE